MGFWNQLMVLAKTRNMANPLVRPHSNNTSKQYDILIIRGSMKTLAIRSDFDFNFFMI